MNRCRFLQFAAAGALVFATFAGTAQAQAQQSFRSFNDRVQRGKLSVLSPTVVRLNGRTINVAPGTRLRDEQNRVVLLSNQVGRKFLVNYELDSMGQLGRVWVLTPAERAQVLPGEESRMKAANAIKYQGPVFQPGKPLNEQHQFPSQF